MSSSRPEASAREVAATTSRDPGPIDSRRAKGGKVAGKRIALCVLAGLALVCTAAAQNDTVRVELFPPPQNKLTQDDLWHSRLTNTGGPVTVYLHGYLMKGEDIVLSGYSSNTITLAPGPRALTARDITGVRDLHYMRGYEAFTVRGGTAPEGEYQSCLEVYETGSDRKLGSKCIAVTVRPAGAPRLISPRDGSVVSTLYPQFVWTPSSPPVPGEIYEFKMVEVMSGQTKEEAMGANPPWFEKRAILTTSLTYPTGARTLVAGKTFAWKVTTGALSSAIFSFSVKGIAPPQPLDTIIQLITPTEEHPQRSLRPTFQWKAGKLPKDATFSLVLREVPGKADSGSGRVVLERNGIRGNSLRFPAEAPSLDSAKAYLWEMTGIENRNVVARSPLGLILYTPLVTLVCHLYLLPTVYDYCVGQTITLNAQAIMDHKFDDYSWTFFLDGNPVGGGTEPHWEWYRKDITGQFPATTPGVYDYVLTVHRDGCDLSLTFATVHVYPSTGSTRITDMSDAELPVNPTPTPHYDICQGDEGKLWVQGLQSGFEVTWDYRDLPSVTYQPITDPWGNVVGVGNPWKTNPIQNVCAGNTPYIDRVYRATINPTTVTYPSGPWPTGCPQQVETKTLRIWCPTQAGSIAPVVTSSHSINVVNGQNMICSNNDYPVKLSLTLQNYIGTSILWSPSPLTGQGTPQVTYEIPSANPYTYTATVTNGSCPSQPASFTVKVEDPLTTTIEGPNGAGPMWVCPGAAEELNIVSPTQLPDDAVIQWKYSVNCDPNPSSPDPTNWPTAGQSYPGQNTNPMSPPNINYSYPGLYPAPPGYDEICWTVASHTAACTQDNYSNVFHFKLYKPPELEPISPDLIMKCKGAQVTLPCPTVVPGTGTGPFTYEWWRFESDLPVGTGCQVKTSQTGKYYCRVWDVHHCSYTESNVVTVEDCLILIAIDGACCSDGKTPITLTASATSTCPPVTYQWTGPGGPYPPGPSITLNPPPTATSVYKVKVTDGLGCHAMASWTIVACH
jgi:hypothetical protein